jgi:hypothetical protein
LRSTSNIHNFDMKDHLTVYNKWIMKLQGFHPFCFHIKPFINQSLLAWLSKIYIISEIFRSSNPHFRQQLNTFKNSGLQILNHCYFHSLLILKFLSYQGFILSKYHINHTANISSQQNVNKMSTYHINASYQQRDHISSGFKVGVSEGVNI